jgi:hypothetical protein
MSGRQPDRVAQAPARPLAASRASASTRRRRHRRRPLCAGGPGPLARDDRATLEDLATPDAPGLSPLHRTGQALDARGSPPAGDLASSARRASRRTTGRGRTSQGRFASSSTHHVERGQRQTHRPVTSLSLRSRGSFSDNFDGTKLRPRIPVCGSAASRVSRWSGDQTGLPRGGTPRDPSAWWRTGYPLPVNPLVPSIPVARRSGSARPEPGPGVHLRSRQSRSGQDDPDSRRRSADSGQRRRTLIGEDSIGATS